MPQRRPRLTFRGWLAEWWPVLAILAAVAVLIAAAFVAAVAGWVQ